MIIAARFPNDPNVMLQKKKKARENVQVYTWHRKNERRRIRESFPPANERRRRRGEVM